MTPEERQMLQEALELAKDNNRIIRKMRRSMVWGRFFRVFYWLIIIGITVGAFYAFQPYLDSLMGTFSSVQQNVEVLKDVTDQSKELLNIDLGGLKLP